MSKQVRGFFTELRRRKVIRTAAVYLGMGFLVMQILDLVVDPLRLPAYSETLALVLLSLGFPISVALAWVLEITPSCAGGRIEISRNERCS